MNKRFLAIVLSVCMLLSVMPTIGFAADAKATLKVTADKSVVQTGDIITCNITLSATADVNTVYFLLDIPEGLSYVANSGDVDANLKTNTGADGDCAFDEAELMFTCGKSEPLTINGEVAFGVFQCKVDTSVNGEYRIGLAQVEITDAGYNPYDEMEYNVSSATVTIPKAPLTSVDFTVTAPVKGEAPQTTVGGESDPFTGTVTWSPKVNNNQFAGETAYTATVTLNAKEGETFGDITAPAGYTLVSDSPTQIVLTKTFSETGAKTTDPNYEVPTGLKATYGQTLADVDLPDGWAWIDKTTSVGDVLDTPETFQAKYTPDNTDLYKEELADLSVTVNPKDISDETVTIPNIVDQPYTGDAIRPKPYVKDGDTYLKEGTDFTYDYSNNTAQGTATVTITGKGNYTGTVTKDFKIVAAPGKITISGDLNVTYGTTVPDVTVDKKTDTGAVTVYYYTNEACTEGKTVTKPVNAGTYYVQAELAAGENYGAATSNVLPFTISPATYTYTAPSVATTVTVGAATPAGGAATASGVKSETVDGTLAWYTNAAHTTTAPATFATVGKTTLYWVFTPAADETNYVTTTTEGSVEITVSDLPGQSVAFEQNTVTKAYGDASFTNAATNSTENGGAVTYAVTAGADVAEVNTSTGEVTIKKAGTATITATAAGVADKYAPTSVSYTLTVNPKEITPVIAVTGTYTYDDGKAITPTYTVTFDQEETLAAAEYDVKVTDNVDAGTAKITVTDKEGGNYTFAEIEETFEIGKAPAKTLADKNTSVKFTATGAQTYALTGLGEGIEGYAAGTKSDADSIIASWSVANGTVTYTLSDKSAAGKTATLPVTVSYKNYKDSTVNVVITLTDKDPSGSSVDSAFTKTYDGKAVTFADIHAAAKVAGTWAWAEGTVAPMNAQAATEYTLVFTPTDTANYATEVQKVSITINKATITVKADDIAIKVNETVPAATYTVTGLVNGETLIKEPTVAIEGTVDNTKEGEYTITASGAEAPNTNYNDIVYVAGKLTISNKNTVITPVGPKPQQPTQPEEPEVTPSFGDVAGEWFEADVEYVAEKGLMNGVGDGSMFAPLMDTSRGMIVTILWRMEGQPVPKAPAAFTDVEKGAYYEQAVAWASENGIVNGYGATFGPNDNITREQFATILFRYAQFKGYDVSVGEDTNILSYADAFSVSEYAIPAMQWACGAGLINGIGDTLQPAGAASRAQAAAILHRFCENVIQ